MPEVILLLLLLLLLCLLLLDDSRTGGHGIPALFVLGAGASEPLSDERRHTNSDSSLTLPFSPTQ